MAAINDVRLQVERDFVNTLEQSPRLREEVSRELLLNNINTRLGANLGLRQHATTRTYVIELVHVCARLPDGLEILTDELAYLDPLAPEVPRLRCLCDEWQAIRTYGDETWPNLRSTLYSVTLTDGEDQQAELTALRQLTIRAARPHMTKLPVHCTTLWHAFVYLTGTKRFPNTLPTCMSLLECVAQDTDDASLAQGLREWNHSWAQRWQLTDLLAPAPDAALEEHRTRARTSLTVWGGVPPRNPNFTGREDLLRQLHERLEPGVTTAVLPQTLHGLGGVGKSQLAVEYAYRHRTDFDVIWWIPAELTVQIQSSLAELGQRLEMGIPSEVNVAVGVVLDALKGSGRGGRHVPVNWLLIFDNAEDPQSVLEYLPTGGPGRILVTSRNSQWLNLARPLEVDVFQRGESVELLQRRGPDLADEDADRLAAALGDLPLAIEQAAAWRAETGMPAGEYIQLLNEKQDEMLNLPGPLDYQKSVAAAWNLSLDKLRASNPAALRVLQVCAFFAPEPVPRAMFANARGISVEPDLDRALHDRLRLSEVIRDINRYALARIDHRNNSIQIHRLVQAVLLSEMSAEERATMRHGAHLLLAANDPLTPGSAEHWARYSQLYPHVLASNAIDCDDSAVRELAYNIVQFLHFWGEPRASRTVSQQIYDRWRDHRGPEHPETLRIGRWLGFMLWAAGEFQQAAEFNAELLEIHRRVLGDGHEDTLDAIGSVAGDRRARGDFAGALAASRTIHQRCVRRFGENDPLTLNSAHNLAVSLRLSGHFAEAREWDEATWQRKVDMFGTDHALSLLTQVGLTLDLRELGDYVAASTVHDDIVARYQAVHGPLNPATLRAVMHQAGMRRKAGDYPGAAAAADEAFEGLFSQFGQDHPDTIAAQLSRSINLRLMGDLTSACRLGTDVLERYRTVLGVDHPHTLAAGTDLAVSLRRLGELDQARELDQAALDGFRARLGEDHPSTVVALVNLASDLFAIDRHQAAYDLNAMAVETAARMFGDDHPITLTAMANMAQDLRALGRDDEGKALQVEVRVGAVRKLGVDNPAASALINPELRVNYEIEPMPL